MESEEAALGGVRVLHDDVAASDGPTATTTSKGGMTCTCSSELSAYVFSLLPFSCARLLLYATTLLLTFCAVI